MKTLAALWLLLVVLVFLGVLIKTVVGIARDDPEEFFFLLAFLGVGFVTVGAISVLLQ